MDEDFNQLKKQAAAYYNENGVPGRLEEILNSMFFENPKDIYGRLVKDCIFVYSGFLCFFLQGTYQDLDRIFASVETNQKYFAQG